MHLVYIVPGTIARTLLPLLRMPTGATPWPGMVRKTGVSSTSTWLQSLSGMLPVMTGIPFMVVDAGVGLIDEDDADGAGAAGSWEQPVSDRPSAATATARVTLRFFMDFSFGRGLVVRLENTVEPGPAS